MQNLMLFNPENLLSSEQTASEITPNMFLISVCLEITEKYAIYDTVNQTVKVGTFSTRQ